MMRVNDAGKIVELKNFDRSVVDKATTGLKTNELITSSKRCYL